MYTNISVTKSSTFQSQLEGPCFEYCMKTLAVAHKFIVMIQIFFSNLAHKTHNKR